MDQFIGKDREDLIRRALEHEGIAQVFNSLLQLLSETDRMTSQIKIKLIPEQLRKLDPKQPPLGKHTTLLLDHIAEERRQFR